MSDDVSEDRPQHRELRPLFFSNNVCGFFNVPERFVRRDLRFIVLIRED